jgi:hypothetical protein
MVWSAAWPTGPDQTSAAAFAIRPASLGYWIEQLVRHGVKHDGPARRFGEQVLSFRLIVQRDLVRKRRNSASWQIAHPRLAQQRDVMVCSSIQHRRLKLD